jgi:predicted Zn-dependent protease
MGDATLSIRTPRMEQIEALLADDPNDGFLLYGLAMEYASAGDETTAAGKLLELIEKQPYVPAYLQAGQMLNRLGRDSEAGDVLRQGIAAAKQQGDSHAQGEMEGLLSAL